MNSNRVTVEMIPDTWEHPRERHRLPRASKAATKTIALGTSTSFYSTVHATGQPTSVFPIPGGPLMVMTLMCWTMCTYTSCTWAWNVAPSWERGGLAQGIFHWLVTS